MADVLLDTTLFIDLRRSNDAGARALWERIEDGDLLGAYSPLTVYELWVGQRFDRAEEVFYESLCSLLEEAPLTGNAARLAGRWLRNFTDERSEVLARDALTAATAAQRGESVCTMNQRDFARFGAKVITY